MLLQQFHSLLERGWQSVFPQARTRRRAIQHAVALPCVFGRRTITRTLGALGRSDCDWSADYKMFSRCHWQPEQLFTPVIDEYLERYPQAPVVAAIDDTKLRKTGKKIKGACWQRDLIRRALFQSAFKKRRRSRSRASAPLKQSASSIAG